ncbi:hypothetical protein [Clostridium botulinum]|uniref:hypothetical protein n=1 Tax=Clostridium botulinum TaxID=1491 RepID=UPI00211B29D0|nr:hypothetical protein [Clostridium botulinum]
MNNQYENNHANKKEIKVALKIESVATGSFPLIAVCNSSETPSILVMLTGLSDIANYPK